MKYTNIKKLLIKFMGGGLINFPTRFLRWIKIDGDADGDGGSDGDSGGSGGDGEETIDAVIFLANETYSAVPFADTTMEDIDNAEYAIELMGFKEPPAECTHIFSAEEYNNL